MALAASVAHAESRPVWTASVPAHSGFTNSSTVGCIVSEAPSSTLAVIYHKDLFNSGVGTQLVLIGAQGQVLATGKFWPLGNANYTVLPLRVTPRKVIVLCTVWGSTGVQEGIVDNSKELVFRPLSYSSGTEQLLQPTSWTPEFNCRRLFTTTSVANKVVEIRRYSVTKMQP